MTDDPLTDEQLEAMLLDATSGATAGRQAMARVTAIRTILRRRPARADDDEDHRRALEIVNATRGPDEQLSEIHPVDVASVLVNPEWAPLVRSDEEMLRARFRRFSGARARHV